MAYKPIIMAVEILKNDTLSFPFDVGQTFHVDEAYIPPYRIKIGAIVYNQRKLKQLVKAGVLKVVKVRYGQVIDKANNIPLSPLRTGQGVHTSEPSKLEVQDDQDAQTDVDLRKLQA